MTKKRSAAVAVVLGITLLGGVAPAHAATTVDADLNNVVAVQKGSKYTTSAVVKITAPKRGKTLKVTTSFNPAGSVKATGKTQSKVVKAKWNKAGYYTATVKYTAKNVGKLSVSAKPSGKKVSAKHSFKLTPQVVSARSTQTGKNAFASTFTLRVIAPKQGSTLKVTTSFNPAGSVKATGKTQSKVVKAKWNKAGYYTATVKFTAKNVGSFNFVARPMGTRVTLKKAATTGTVNTSLSVSGAQTQTVTGATTRTVSVTPAYGRTVKVQELSGSTWATIQTLTTANVKKAAVTFTLPAPAAGKSRVLRVVADKATGVQGETSKTITLSKKAASNPPSTGGNTGGGGANAGGSEPTPTPSSSATPTPNPTEDWGAQCNAYDGWGTTAYPCDTPAWGYVLDRKIPGDLMGCGVTSNCQFEYVDDFGDTVNMSWETKTWVEDGAIDTLLAPDWLTSLNDWRVKNGQKPVKAFDVSTSSYGYIAQGQGGVAQTQAETILNRLVAEGRTSTQTSDHIKSQVLNAAWSEVTGKKITNCAENIVASYHIRTYDHYTQVWAASAGHNSTMLYPDLTHAAVGLVRNEAGQAAVVLQVCVVPE